MDSSKKIDNKFTIKTSTKIERSKIPQKTTVVDSRKKKINDLKSGEFTVMGKVDDKQEK